MFLNELGAQSSPLIKSSQQQTTTHQWQRGVDEQFSEGLFASYKRRRGDLDKLIEACRKDPDLYDCRIVAWVKFMDQAKKIDSPLVRLSMISGFINMLINYDTAKAEQAVNFNKESQTDRQESMGHYLDYVQTPQKTLQAGRGVCIDMALLKYETLLHSGFGPEQVKLLNLKVVYKNGSPQVQDTATHSVDMVEVNGNQWILDDDQGDIGQVEQSQCFLSDNAVEIFSNDGIIVPAPLVFDTIPGDFNYGGKRICYPKEILDEKSTLSHDGYPLVYPSQEQRGPVEIYNHYVKEYQHVLEDTDPSKDVIRRLIMQFSGLALDNNELNPYSYLHPLKPAMRKVSDSTVPADPH